MSQETSVDSMIGKVLFNRFKINGKLGEGSFGAVYLVQEGSEMFAMKCEDVDSDQKLLESEAEFLNYLKGGKVPYVKYYGTTNGKHILIMELMGKCLEDLLESLPSKRMSIRCVCNIGIQILDILEYIHDKHIIHRDIKPENFVLGSGVNGRFVYILDFGLAKKYRSSKTLQHYPMTNSKRLTGTARYASINALKGYSQSRRDDLEAVGYMLMYFLKGKLPWQGLQAKHRDERYQKIMLKKQSTSPEELCSGFPNQFTEYIKYTRSLGYEDNPNYNYLKGLLISALTTEGFQFDYYYDWNANCNVNNNQYYKYNNMIPSKQINLGSMNTPFGTKPRDENVNYVNEGLNSNNLHRFNSKNPFSVEPNPNIMGKDFNFNCAQPRIGFRRGRNKTNENGEQNLPNNINNNVNDMNGRQNNESGACCIIM